MENGWVRVDPEDEKDGVLNTFSEGQVNKSAVESATDLKQTTTPRNSKGRAETWLETSGSRQNCDFVSLFLTNLLLLSRF